ncbi:hypothetical protein ACWEKM_34595 [Streptomyces sp. NPDC004752]
MVVVGVLAVVVAGRVVIPTLVALAPRTLTPDLRKEFTRYLARVTARSLDPAPDAPPPQRRDI